MGSAWFGISLTCAAACLSLASAVGAQEKPGASPPAAARPIVTVGTLAVSMPEFELAVRQAMRKKFYHGKVPEAQVVELQREVADQIVNQTLLLDEAKRRGIQPRAEKMKQAVSGFDERYGNSANWKENRERMLGQVVPELERRDVLEQIEQSVREVPVPKEEEVQAFYEARKDLFTEPEKLRLSLILLKVDPSSGKLVWDKAKEEGQAIHKRLLAGADFAELAKLHSGDESASRGGDMGYLHRGMLPEDLQVKVDSFKLGEIQEPMVTLHGVAILRLDERVPPKLRAYKDVRDRATDLLRRERGDRAWQDLIAKLRKTTPFTIQEERFAELAARLQ